MQNRVNHSHMLETLQAATAMLVLRAWLPKEIIANILSTPNDFKIEAKDLPITRNPLNKGAFGEVYLGSWKGKKVAVKKPIKNNRNPGASGAEEIFQNEKEMMIKIAQLPNYNQYIVEFHGYVPFRKNENKIPRALVIEYMDGGNLEGYINSPNYNLLDSLRYSRDAVCGLEFLHTNKLIHRDMKVENIMIQSNHAKLIDFGFTITQDNSVLAHLEGTPEYLAPELLASSPHEYTTQADMYAFAMVLCFLFTRRGLYNDLGISDVQHLFQLVYNGTRPFIPNNIVPPGVVDLITTNWMGSPVHRYNASTVKTKLEKLIEIEEKKNIPSNTLSI